MSLYSPEVHRDILTAIAAGCTRHGAAEYAGISPRTLFRWLADEENEKYIELREAVRRAEGLRRVRWLKVIEQASADDWKAAAWLLEHIYPAEYGKGVSAAVQEEIMKFLDGLRGRLKSTSWHEVLNVACEQTGIEPIQRRSPEPAGEH